MVVICKDWQAQELEFVAELYNKDLFQYIFVYIG